MIKLASYMHSPAGCMYIKVSIKHYSLLYNFNFDNYCHDTNSAGTRISHRVCKGLYLLSKIVHMRDSEIDQVCMHDLSLYTSVLGNRYFIYSYVFATLKQFRSQVATV